MKRTNWFIDVFYHLSLLTTVIVGISLDIESRKKIKDLEEQLQLCEQVMEEDVR